MKRFLPSLVFVLFCVTVSIGQAPKGINYQGVARDNEGNPYSSKTISVRISILKNQATGEVEYAETHKPQTNQFGLFTLVIGQGTKLTGDFAFISWAVGNKWLQVEIDPNGGSSFTVAGTQQLMTVPYAFYAEYSGNSSGLTAGTGININSGVVSNTGDADNDSNNELQNLSEVLTKSNNAGGIKITNLGAPVAGADAATKSYVDAQNALQNLAEILTRGNDAGAKQIKNLGAPTDATDAATKNYVDTKFALDLDIDPTNELQDLAQVLIKGNNAGGNKITNLGAPTTASDAATKNYVDAQSALDLDKDPTNELQNLSQVLAKGNDAGTQKITNLGTPTVAGDAATKNYVDAQNALDLDQIPTNELQNLAQVLSQGANANDAGAKKITNLGTPTVNSDATTKLYVDNAIARNFAFKTGYDFKNTSGGIVINQTIPFLATPEFDSFGVLASNTFTAQEDGIYVLVVEGSYKTTSGFAANLTLKVSGVAQLNYVAMPGIVGNVNYNSTFMFKLVVGQTIIIFSEAIANDSQLVGNFFGYKL